MINGIDISHHNAIDWRAIQRLNLTQNLYFSFAKVSEGLGTIDNKFNENRIGSTNAGLLCGGYHFFLPTEDPAAQAKIFGTKIASLQPGELPPVVDIEWTLIKNKAGKTVRSELWKKVPPRDRIAIVKTFIEETEKHLGIKPIIYTAVSFWTEFITTPNHAADYAFFIDYPLWVVNLKGALTAPKPWAIPTFVQNGFGELAPKNATAFEKLDHDYFNGKLNGLLAFAFKGKVFLKGSPISPIVRDFQQSLKNLGFYAKQLDGDFGKNTQQAVKDFQKFADLPETGQIDDITRKILL